MIISMLVPVLLASQHPDMLDMPMTCAVAIHIALRQADKGEGRAEPSRDLLELSSKYSTATCFESRKKKGRWVVIFAPGGLLLDGSLVYVVEPDMKIRQVRGVPCEDHPVPTVCE